MFESWLSLFCVNLNYYGLVVACKCYLNIIQNVHSSRQVITEYNTFWNGCSFFAIKLNRINSKTHSKSICQLKKWQNNIQQWLNIHILIKIKNTVFFAASPLYLSISMYFKLNKHKRQHSLHYTECKLSFSFKLLAILA